MQLGNNGQVIMAKEHIHEQSHGSKLVSVSVLPSGVALITLGSPDEGATTLTPDRISALEAAIAQVADMKPKGVIITGSGEDMFSVGADVSLIRNVKDASVGARLAREGQRVFDKITSLTIPSVAAISGPCVGGGFELALACSYRICSDAKSTLIGLPEVKLGILPGFGGTQRLPRLVGLPRALDVILAGKTLRAKQALKMGLVCEVVPYSGLIERAEGIILNTSPVREQALSFTDRFLTFNAIGRYLVKRKATATLEKQTKGFYPAPPAALNSCLYGLDNGITDGLEFEAEELGRLIVTPESKALVKIFFLTEASKSIGKSGRKELEGISSLVVGAGVMGAGIASLFAKHDIPVVLHDKMGPQVQHALSSMKDSLQKLAYLSDTERSAIMERVKGSSDAFGELHDVTFAIEAIVEDMQVKKEVLSEIASKISEDALIATNTSSLSVSEIASSVPYPERVVGMHFFNPVEKMPLVEIIRGEETSVRAIVLTAALATRLGKFPIVVEDVPGFLVNRILTPYLNAAAILLGDGYSMTAIDRAATSFGMPMGPFRLLDEVGLDVAAHVAEVMKAGYGARMEAPPYSKLLVDKGRKGRKNGAGFYDFEGEKTTPYAGLKPLLSLPSTQKEDTHNFLQSTLIAALVNEAVLCLDEGVAGQPGKDAAHQIDLGSVMGFGFPAFRGGVLHYAEHVGPRKIVEALREAEKRYGERFTPCNGLIARTEEEISFYD